MVRQIQNHLCVTLFILIHLLKARIFPLYGCCGLRVFSCLLICLFCLLWSHLLLSSGVRVHKVVPGHLKGLMYNRPQQVLLSLHFSDSGETERVPLWDWMSGFLVSPKMGEGSRRIPEKWQGCENQLLCLLRCRGVCALQYCHGG